VAADGESDPLLEHKDETGDDDDGGEAPPGSNETGEFGPPRAESTPGRRQTKMNTTGEESYSFPDTPGLSTTNFGEEQLKRWYPKYNNRQIFTVIENDTLKVRLLSGKKNLYSSMTKGKKNTALTVI